MEKSQSQRRSVRGRVVERNVDTSQPESSRRTEQRRKISCREYTKWKETGEFPHSVPVKATKRGINEVEVTDIQWKELAGIKKKKVRFSGAKFAKQDSLRSNNLGESMEIDSQEGKYETHKTIVEEAMDVDQEGITMKESSMAVESYVSEVPKNAPKSVPGRGTMTDKGIGLPILSNCKQRISRPNKTVPTRPYSGRNLDKDTSLSPIVPPIKLEEEDFILPEIQLNSPVESPSEASSKETNNLDLTTESRPPIHLVPYFANTIKPSSAPITITLPQMLPQRSQEQAYQQSPVQTLCTYEQYRIDQSHLNIIYWKPFGRHVLPHTKSQERHYIDAIADAFLDTAQVLDKVQYPQAFASFSRGDIYTSLDIETKATAILQCAINLHRYGSTNLFFKNPFNRPRRVDACLCFFERMTAFMRLVRQFKKAADHIMCERHWVEYLAAPTAHCLTLKQHLLGWQRSNAPMAREIAAQNEGQMTQARGGMRSPVTP